MENLTDLMKTNTSKTKPKKRRSRILPKKIYRKPKTKQDQSNKENKILKEFAGPYNSVNFELKENSSDYAYKILPIDQGFRIMIFSSDIYPDVLSGTINELILSYNTENNIVIEPHLIEGSEYMESITPNERRCLFKNEISTYPKRWYYQNDCLLNCRINDIIRNCGCTPPLLPNKQNETYCTLVNLQCLLQWKEQWFSTDYFFQLNDNIVYIPEKNPCEHCYSECTYIKYKVKHSSLSLENSLDTVYKNSSKNLTNQATKTFVKIYIHSTDVLQSLQSVNVTWLVMLNNFGGICSMMFGFCIIAIIEIIYFGTGKFFCTWRYWATENIKAIHRKTIIRRLQTLSHTIYWNEFNKRDSFFVH